MYVDINLLILAMDVATAEKYFIQSLSLILLDFGITLKSITKILKKFTHRRQRFIRSKYIFNDLRPARDSNVASYSA